MMIVILIMMVLAGLCLYVDMRDIRKERDPLHGCEVYNNKTMANHKNTKK
jgi:hypothetical protein